MMECYIHPDVDYVNLPDTIREQRELVTQLAMEASMNHHVFEGRSVLEKLAEMEMITEGTEGETMRINPARIPGVVEAGWTWADHEELKKAKERSFQLQCQNLMDTLRKFKSSWPFYEPVSVENVPDYYHIIKEPIDMKMIDAKIDANQYPDKEMLRRDLYKMFENCTTYNQPDSPYYKAAIDCKAFITPYIDGMREKREQQDESGGKGTKLEEKSLSKKKKDKR